MKKLLFSLFFISFGVTAASQVRPDLKSFIVLNGQKSNTLVWVYHDTRPSYIRLNKLEVINFLKQVISQDSIELLDKIKAVPGDLVSFGQLNEFGLVMMFDNQLLNVLMKIPTQKFRLRNLSLSRKSGRDKYVLSPNNFSAYLNSRFVQDFSNDISGVYKRQPLATQLELVTNLNGLVFETIHSHNRLFGQATQGLPSSAPLANQGWGRENSRLTYDFENSMVRTELGDINVPVMGFMKPVFGGGFALRRLFTLNQNFLRGDFFKREITVENPGVLEVYVNEKMVHRERVQAGPYSLSNFPLMFGDNEIQIKVIDDFGKIQENVMNAYQDPMILPNKISEYALSVDFDRINPTTKSFDYEWEDPLVSAFYRIGTKYDSVFGINAQHSKDDWLTGLEYTFASKLGVFSFNTAFNKNNIINENGYALKLENRNLNWNFSRFNPTQLRLSFEYQTEHFNRIDNGFSFNGQSYVFDIHAAQRHQGAFRTGFGFRKVGFHNNFPTKNILYANSGWNMSKDWFFNIKYQTDLKDKTSHSITLNLNFLGGEGRTQLFNTYDTFEDRLTSNAYYNPRPGQENLRLNAVYGHDSRSDSYGGGFNYHNQRIELGGNHLTTKRPNTKVVNNTQLSAGIGLAFAGSSIAITRPIQESFAIVDVEGSRSFREEDIHINRYRDNSRGAITGLGPAVLSRVASYYKDRVKIDATALPNGISLDDEYFEFRSTYKSGIEIVSNVTGTYAIKGRFIDESGEIFPRLVGEVRDDNGKFVTEFFTNKSGVFFVEEIDYGKQFLVFEAKGRKYKVEFNVDGKNYGLVDLGDIKVRGKK